MTRVTRQCEHVHVGTHMLMHVRFKSSGLFFIIDHPVLLRPCLDDRVMACSGAVAMVLNDTLYAVGFPPDQKIVLISIDWHLKFISYVI